MQFQSDQILASNLDLTNTLQMEEEPNPNVLIALASTFMTGD